MEVLYDSGVDFKVWAFIVQGKVRMWRHLNGRLLFSDVAKIFAIEEPRNGC